MNSLVSCFSCQSWLWLYIKLQVFLMCPLFIKVLVWFSTSQRICTYQTSRSHTGPLCPWYITLLVQFSTSQMICLQPPEVSKSHTGHCTTSISVLVLFIKVLVWFPTSQRIYLHSPKSRSHQGMTIRTARLPGAGNLLGWAGEDLSGLPDRASCYQFFGFFF